MLLELTEECDPSSLLDSDEIQLCDEVLLVLDLVVEVDDSELTELFDPLTELLLKLEADDSDWLDVELLVSDRLLDEPLLGLLTEDCEDAELVDDFVSDVEDSELVELFDPLIELQLWLDADEVDDLVTDSLLVDDCETEDSDEVELLVTEMLLRLLADDCETDDCETDDCELAEDTETDEDDSS